MEHSSHWERHLAFEQRVVAGARVTVEPLVDSTDDDVDRMPGNLDRIGSDSLQGIHLCSSRRQVKRRSLL